MRPGRSAERPVDPIALRFRLRLIAKTGLALAVGVAGPLGVFWLLTADLRASSYAEAMRSLGQMRMALLTTVVLSAGVQTVLAGLLISGVALFASHKIAGPLVRFERHVKGLAEGEFDQTVAFRRGDQDQTLPHVFHELCQRLSQRVEVTREVARELRDLQEQARQLASGQAPTEEKFEAISDRLRRKAEALRRASAFDAQRDDFETD